MTHLLLAWIRTDNWEKPRRLRGKNQKRESGNSGGRAAGARERASATSTASPHTRRPSGPPPAETPVLPSLPPPAPLPFSGRHRPPRRWRAQARQCDLYRVASHTAAL